VDGEDELPAIFSDNLELSGLEVESPVASPPAKLRPTLLNHTFPDLSVSSAGTAAAPRIPLALSQSFGSLGLDNSSNSSSRPAAVTASIKLPGARPPLSATFSDFSREFAFFEEARRSLPEEAYATLLSLVQEYTTEQLRPASQRNLTAIQSKLQTLMGEDNQFLYHWLMRFFGNSTARSPTSSDQLSS
jgi:hypothetical protein